MTVNKRDDWAARALKGKFYWAAVAGVAKGGEEETYQDLLLGMDGTLDPFWV